MWFVPVHYFASSYTTRSPSSATHLPGDLDRTFQLPYGSKSSSMSMIFHTHSPKQRQSWPHSVFVWTGTQKDCRTWTRACQSCQCYKFSRHSFTLLGDFTPTAARFLHVRIYLVGPLPTACCTYCLTAVDRFNRRSEVVPIPDITADTVARALLTSCICRFGCLQTITTDQERQFESKLCQSLARLCGIQLSRTTTHHPAAKGLSVDRSASRGSPGNLHGIRRGPTHISN
jgi:hypothetical protein